MSAVKENLLGLQARIAAAAARAGRSTKDVRLLAVSKRQPESLIEEGVAAGLLDFGENYAQELRDKAVSFAARHPSLRWHAIGPLQANKAKYVAKVAWAFHALDSVAIAQELSRRREGEPLRVFLEVNVADEATKSGVRPADTQGLLDAVRKLPGLLPVGLMTLPPLGDDAESARPYFRTLAELGRRLSLPELSMGTTADFEVAIEEGATWVRVGTLLFGERPQRGGRRVRSPGASTGHRPRPSRGSCSRSSGT